jgi:hypothetical protein
MPAIRHNQELCLIDATDLFPRDLTLFSSLFLIILAKLNQVNAGVLSSSSYVDPVGFFPGGNYFVFRQNKSYTY